MLLPAFLDELLMLLHAELTDRFTFELPVPVMQIHATSFRCCEFLDYFHSYWDCSTNVGKRLDFLRLQLYLELQLRIVLDFEKNSDTVRLFYGSVTSSISFELRESNLA